jgi:enoyl-CoA hydratase/carnithine racemase
VIVGSEELLAWEIVNRATDSGQAIAEAVRLARQLASCAPNVLDTTEELLRQTHRLPLNEHSNAESLHFADTLPRAYGIAALAQKRTPRLR